MADKPTYEELNQRVKELERAALEHQGVEKRLLEIENRFHLLYERAPLSYQSLDMKGNLIEVNQTWLDTLGYTRDEVIDKNITDFLHPDWVDHFKENFPRFKALGEILGAEFEMVKKDGSRVLVSGNGKIGHNGNGKSKQTHFILYNITEERKREMALRKSEESFRNLLSLSPNPIAIIQNNRHVLINQAHSELFGYTMQDVDNGLDQLQLIPEKEHERVLGRITDKFKGKEPEQKLTTMELETKDGNKVPCEISGSVIEYDSQPAYFVILRNITDRKQAEEALRKSEKKYRLIAENVTDVIWTMDMNLRLTYISPSVTQHSGFTVEEAMSHSLDEIMVPKSRLETMALLKQKLKLIEAGDGEGWAPISFEAEQYCKDHTTIISNNNAKILKGPDGRPNLILGVTHNISDRKRAEEALLESEDQFRSLFEQSNDAIIIHNLKSELLNINNRTCELLGYDKETLLNMTIFDLYPKNEHFEAQKALEETMEKGSVRFESQFKKSDGSLFDVEISSSIVDEKKGTVQGIVRDITESVNAQQEKDQLQIQLQQSQKMEAIGTLAGGIAHDFNNILSAVFGFTELAIDDVEPGSRMEVNLQEVMVSAKRATDLVQQILTFSRQTEHELKPVQIKLIAKEALKLLRASLPSTIEIRQNLQSDSLVMSNPTKIHQILMNLCTNAGHAMAKNGGVLEVGLENIDLYPESDDLQPEVKPGPYIKLTVSDTGHGMAHNVLDRIFDPFFTTKEKGEGTGMGLSVVHGVVKSSGGVINVDSEMGKGSTFEILFPAIKRKLEPEDRAETPIPKGTEHILFVDDEQSLAKMTEQLLESLGYKITIRTSSTDALELFKEEAEDFDLVITDMTMPNMTGDELARQLIAVRPDIPIILCTGFSAKITEAGAKSIGIRKLILKPILKRDIAEAIRDILDGKK